MTKPRKEQWDSKIQVSGKDSYAERYLKKEIAKGNQSAIDFKEQKKFTEKYRLAFQRTKKGTASFVRKPPSP
jgi:hypothetical protein